MSYRNLLLILILFASGFAVYSFNLNNPLFWDDTDWIVNNPFVHSLSLESVKNWFTKNTLAGIGLRSNYYRPFLFFTFASNYVLHGSNPIGYHLINNLLHIGNGIFIFLLLSKVFKNWLNRQSGPKPTLRAGSSKVPPAQAVAESLLPSKEVIRPAEPGSKFIPFFVSLLFLLHPLQTEAVTYVAGRGDPLNVFLMLLGLLLFYKAEQGNLPWKSPVRFLTLPILTLALLSRETAIIFPFLLLVFYIAFISKSAFWLSLKKSFIKALPYFGIVFIYGILRLTVLNFQNTLNFYTQPNAYSESFFVRMLTFLGVLTEYVKLIFAPAGLHMERSVNVFSSPFHWPVAIALTSIILLLILLIYSYKKSRTGFNILFFSSGWFFINLAPTSGITPINAVMYEHWLYLALVGPLTLIVFYLNQWRQKYSVKKVLSFMPALLLICSAVWFSFISIQRNILWGKPIAFFEDILKYEPSSARINNNIGNLYYNEKNIAKAEEYYWRAIGAEDSFAQPHYNIGAILMARNDVFGAISAYERAVEIDPYFHYAYEALISIYAQQGDLVKASEYIEKLKLIVPNNPRTYYNAALIYIARKDFDSAVKNLEQGLKYAAFDAEGERLIKELLAKLDHAK